MVASIVTREPRGGFRIEEHLQCKLAQLHLDVTWRRGAVASQNVAPVSLAIQQQLTLADLDHGIPDARIPVRVELHGVANDIRHLVEATIVHFAQTVQNPSLHWLQSIVLVRNGSLENHIARVIEEIVVVHPSNGNDMFHFTRLGSCILASELVVPLVSIVVVKVLVDTHASVTSSFSTRRFSMMNFCRLGVFLPMKNPSIS